MALSSQETVEVLLHGGVKGSIGPLEAIEMYWNNDYASLVPLGSPNWGGVAVQADPAVPIGQYIYGSADTPYFKSAPGKEYYWAQQDKLVSGVSFNIGIGTGPATYGVIANYFDENGVNFYQENCGNIPVSYFNEAIGNEVFVTWGAGYNDNNGEYFATLVMGYDYEDGVVDPVIKKNSTSVSLIAGNIPIAVIAEWADGQKPIEDDGVSPTGGSGGGGGTYSRPDEAIGIPGLPSINLADLGLCSIYHVTPQQCADFSAYLWTPGGFIDTVLKNAQAPMENVISLSMVPAIAFNEAGAEILIGNAASGVQGYKLMTTFYELDFGSIYVNEYYKTFGDYRTELQIYLPFIGIRDIPINDCMNGYIKVVYHVDVFSGQCIAFIQTQVAAGAWHVVASYNGSIACQVPLSGANYMGVFNGVLGAVGSAVSGNIVGAAGALMNAKPEYQRSGNIGSTAGLMGIRYPYLIFTTPQYFTATTFRQDNGYISNLSGKLSDFIDPRNPYDQHYVQVDTDKLDLNGLVITEEERDLLYDVMNRGIYISRIREGE